MHYLIGDLQGCDDAFGHLLAVAQGVRPEHASDTLRKILDAPDREAWLDWLRQRPPALMREGWLCVHAGVEHGADAGAGRRGRPHAERPRPGRLPPLMYGNEPSRWSDTLPTCLQHGHTIACADRAPKRHCRRPGPASTAKIADTLTDINE